jgi:hypothetical protein
VQGEQRYSNVSPLRQCVCSNAARFLGGATRRGKKRRTLAGAFEPIFTMMETRAACCFGRHPHCASGAAESRCAIKVAYRERREVSRAQSNAPCEEVLRSDRPLVERDLVRVLVACGQGQPCVRRKSSREPTKRPAPRTPCEWRSRVVPEGRKCPAVTRRTSFVPPRHDAVLVTLLRLRGFVCRAAVSVASDRTVRREQTPAMGYGYRRGANLRRVERWRE